MQVTNNSNVSRVFIYKVNGQAKTIKIPGGTSIVLDDLTSNSQIINNNFNLKVNRLITNINRPGITPVFSARTYENSYYYENLYFIVNKSGANGSSSGGGISKYNLRSRIVELLYSFSSTTDPNGGNPRGSLIRARSDGKLYGMTANGGANNFGVIFSYDLSSSTYTKLVDFTGNVGAIGTNRASLPYGDLVEGSNGLLYGISRTGGASNLGTLFYYDIVTSASTTLIDFDGNASTQKGSGPYGRLLEYPYGSLIFYGLTSAGGTNNLGTLFSYNATTSGFTVLQNLSSTSGSSPQSSIIVGGDGLLYGTTATGGQATPAAGVIFSFDIATSGYTRLFEFTGGTGQGANPTGDLLLATDGNYYGMTRLGGATNVGAIFKFTSGYTYTKVFDLVNNAAVGSAPFGRLMQVSPTKLYGFTTVGGTNSLGVIFEYDFILSSYTKMANLSYTVGAGPQHGTFLGV